MGFLAVFLLLISEQTCSKLCSNLVAEEGRAAYSFFMVINGVIACCFFWLSSGLQLRINGITLAYAAAYALTVAVSLVSTLVAYRLVKIAAANILCSAVSLISGPLVGYAVFQEHIDGTVIGKILLMALSVGTLFLDDIKKGETQKVPEAGRKWKIVASLLGLTFVGLFGTLLGKAFAVSTRVTDEKTYFFFTNVFLILGAGLVFLYCCLREKGAFRSSLQLLKPLRLLYLSGSTISTNIAGIIKIGLMAQMAISIYNPTISALGVVAGVVTSLIFKEKPGKYVYLAAAFAGVAMII